MRRSPASVSASSGTSSGGGRFRTSPAYFRMRTAPRSGTVRRRSGHGAAVVPDGLLPVPDGFLSGSGRARRSSDRPSVTVLVFYEPEARRYPSAALDAPDDRSIEGIELVRGHPKLGVMATADAPNGKPLRDRVSRPLESAERARRFLRRRSSARRSRAHMRGWSRDRGSVAREDAAGTSSSRSPRRAQARRRRQGGKERRCSLLVRAGHDLGRHETERTRLRRRASPIQSLVAKSGTISVPREMRSGPSSACRISTASFAASISVRSSPEPGKVTGQTRTTWA